MPSGERIERRQAPPERTSISHDSVVKPRGPHQRATWPGSVQALKTIGRGASKTRVMTSSRSAELVAAPLLSATLLLPDLDLLQEFVQAIEALLPELSVLLQPVGDILERAGLEPAGPPLGLATAR